jgi:exosortase D (VPLPA-CTERM-specific)
MASNSGLSGSLPPRPRPALATPAAWVGVALLALGAAAVLFGESLARVAEAYTAPEFSHGYIIPLISAWLVVQRWPLIRAVRERGAASGWWLVALGTGLAVFSHAANIVSLPYLGIPPVLVGLVATTLGWRAARLVIVPAGFLVFGFPLPATLQVQLSTELQLVSSHIGAAILDGLDIPVLLDGNIIDLGVMKLQVAEACSGLRYLLPLLSFGVLCAFIYRAPWWAKLVVIAATVPLTVLLNGARIAMIGVFVHVGTRALAEGVMHLFEGWVVFLIALACLFTLMWGLRRLVSGERGFVDMLDFDRMAGRPGGRAPAPAAVAAPSRPAAPLLVATATLVAGALLLIPLALKPQVVPERPGLATYPLQLSPWRGTPDTIPPAQARVLGADDHLLVDYARAGADAPVNLWVAYYDSLLRDGSHIHKPTVCLPGAGWEYVEFGRFETGLRDFSGRPLTVSRGLIVQGTRRIMLYFWLELRGRHANGQEARLYNLWDSFTTGRSDGALVRLYTPLAPGEDPAAADARLLGFLEAAYPHLAPHVGP